MKKQKKIGDIEYDFSVIGFGCAAIGGYDYGFVDKNNSIRAIKQAWELGINFFDLSDIYGFGNAEIIIATSLGKKCKDAIICSKFGLRKNNTGKVVRDCSLNWIDKALHKSLKRLNIEQIPFYLMHWYDGKTPLEDIVNLLNKYKGQGKIGKFGVCNLSEEQYVKFCKIGGDRILQLPFSPVNTSFGLQLKKASTSHKSFTIAYDVLGRGLLSGKYLKSSDFHGTDTRQVHEYFESKNFEKNLKIVDCLKDIGDKYRVSPAQVAIKWVMDIGFIDITLVGCKTPEQVLSNSDVFNFNLTDADKKSLSDLLGIKN